MRWRAPLVLLAAYVALTALSFLAGDRYVALWQPLLRVEVRALLPRGLQFETLELATEPERMIVLVASTTEPQAHRGRELPPGVPVYSTTLEAYALHHAVLVLAILAAWPARTWRRRARLLALAAPCVLVTTSLDIPFVLAGGAQQAMLQTFAPERLEWDPLVVYCGMLDHGGRIGLVLAGALLVALGGAGIGRTAPKADPLGGSGGHTAATRIA